MKAFLWHEIKKVSCEWHENGSVLIEAETLNRAREIALSPKEIWNAESESYDISYQKMIGVEREPDAIFDSSSTEERVWIFPNTGCC